MVLQREDSEALRRHRFQTSEVDPGIFLMPRNFRMFIVFASSDIGIKLISNLGWVFKISKISIIYAIHQ